MEEVIGSIPIRSTNQPNNLAEPLAWSIVGQQTRHLFLRYDSRHYGRETKPKDQGPENLAGHDPSHLKRMCDGMKHSSTSRARRLVIVVDRDEASAF